MSLRQRLQLFHFWNDLLVITNCAKKDLSLQPLCTQRIMNANTYLRCINLSRRSSVVCAKGNAVVHPQKKALMKMQLRCAPQGPISLLEAPAPPRNCFLLRGCPFISKDLINPPEPLFSRSCFPPRGIAQGTISLPKAPAPPSRNYFPP